jgi:ABC-2 type transport system ATP-binding protein
MAFCFLGTRETSVAHHLAIETERVGRIYKPRGRKGDRQPRVALNEVTLSVRPGEIFGLLGPNGAGKTTLIKILTTLLMPSSGTARVAGFDVVHQAHDVRPRINMVSGGETSGYGLLTVRENLWMFAQFYGMANGVANERIRQLLDIVKLGDRINTKASELSTGLRQKMNVVRGFLTDPDVLFLDEPTLGLDVGAARDIRAFIHRWMREHPERTVLLTTHYMIEADELCDRVAIINAGRVLACDAPGRLKQGLRRHPIFTLETTILTEAELAYLASVPGVRNVTHREAEGRTILELTLVEEPVLRAIFAEMQLRGIGLITLAKREPTLEDVFVDLVGRSMEDVEHVEPAAAV